MVVQKTVKASSRAELEAEVEALRAELAKVRRELEVWKARDEERVRRVEKEIGKPAKDLK